MTKTTLATVSAVLLLVLTGCGGGDAESKAETPAPTATQTVTETAEPTCEPPAPASATLLARSWGRVIASRGASDHADMASSFSDEAAALRDGFDDGNCDGDPRRRTAALLALEATIVRAGTLVNAANYADVPPLGNKLLQQMGADGQFDAPN